MEDNLEEEKHVFIKDDAGTWIAAVIVSRSKTELLCRTNNDEELTIKLKEFRKSELPYVNSAIVADLVDIKHLHEPGVLVNLISRYEIGKPYTRSRDVIISINPFRWLHHLYSETNQQIYADKLIWQILDRDPRQDLEPHIYEVSALAYAEMAYQGKDQSIIITGESGSGKTEAVKLMMHHLVRIQLGPNHQPGLYQTNYRGLQQSNSANCNVCNVVDRILKTNPLMEAFGNAMTAQNDNSSRFGKYVQFQFDITDSLSRTTIPGKQCAGLVGSFCEVYLLETSRVCSHAANERTFHIFYQLLAASHAQKSLIWKGIVGKTARDFKYIGTPTTNAIDGTSDAIKFSETWVAFAHIGIPESDTVMLMQALCIVLQLGNVDFIFSDDKVEVSANSDFSNVSDLLGISTAQLLPAFTYRTMTTRNEAFKVPLSLSSAVEARDALAKSVYLNAFSWLTDTINSKTRYPSFSTRSQIHVETGTIGLLDIFGFESFATNRFEQLCINYANEKLQHKALCDIFSTVRAEYEFEGLSLDLVEVDSNEQLLHLFDGRGGLIALLNEESYLPKGSCKAFTAKVIENLKFSSLITKPKVGTYNCFGIVHFAGTVLYTTDNFLSSNQDTLPLDLKECVSKCQNPIVTGLQKLISLVQEEGGVSKAMKTTTQHPSTSIPLPSMLLLSSKNEQTKPRNTSIGRQWELKQEIKGKSRPHEQGCSKRVNIHCQSPNPWKDPRRKTPKSISQHQQSILIDRHSSNSNLISETVWSKYRAQLDSLMQKLRETHSRYVRCIKPNTSMSPMECDRLMILKQLRYTGLVPTIALSRALFTKSITNERLLVKFKFMWDMKAYPSKAKRLDTNEARRKLDCEALLMSILASHRFESTHPEVKVRQYAVGKTRSYFRQGVLEWLESTRTRELSYFATILQRFVRGYLFRKDLAACVKAASAIQCWIRTIRQDCASLLLQKHYRSYKQRKHLNQLEKCTLTLQALVRGFQNRGRYKKAKSLIVTIQNWYRNKSNNRKRRIFLASMTIQRSYRGFKSRKNLSKIIKSKVMIQTNFRGFTSRERQMLI